MRWLRKRSKKAGTLVVALQQGGIATASVTRAPGVKPVVNFVRHQVASATSQAAALDRIGKEARGEYECIHQLGFDEYQLLSVEAPNVPPDELKTAIRWRLKDMLDYRVDDATLDVLDVPGDRNAGNRNHMMFAVAARNQLIEQRQNLFADAKFDLRVIDIPEMAQRNISAMIEVEGRGMAMLAFDVFGGLLTVTYGGELYLARRLDVTMAQLCERDEFVRQGYYERITLEVQRSLDHFDRQHNYVTIKGLVLAPLSDEASPLTAYLAENLYMPIDVLDLATVFDFAATPELLARDAQQRHFMTLGAALRQEEVLP